jgi:hypothetical protein
LSETQDFWSRRKARVAAETETEIRTRTAAEREAQVAAVEGRPDAEILAEMGLPDPDTMQAGDDFSVFLKAAIPERIRRRALRRLWLSNPVLANVDGLIEYGEDYTDSARVIENMQTAYQVGKGMLKHVEEMARQQAVRNGTSDPEAVDNTADTDESAHMAAIAPDPAAPTPSVRPPTAGDTPLITTFVAEEAEEGPATLSGTDTAPDVTSFDPAQPSRRRLRFEFET